MILIDKTNNEIQNKDLTLSVVLNTDSFFYSLFDASTGGIKHLFGQNFTNDRDEPSLNPIVDNFLMTESLGQSNLKKIKLAVDSSSFTIVPIEIYLEDERAVYFKNVTFLTKRDKIISLPLEGLDSVFLFVVDQYLFNRILTKWPDAEIYHAAYPVLLKQIELATNPKKNNMYLHVHENKAYCAIFKAGVLQYFNRFRFENSDDFIYHTTLLYKRHDLNRSEDELWISGQLTRDAAIVQDLMKYVYRIEFLSFDGASDFQALDESRPAHYYFDLFAVSSCE